jgi:amino acid adenylation domain-containing protein
LAGELPQVDFSSRTGSASASFEGATVFHTLGEDLARSVRECSRAQNVTTFMVLLAAFKALLARYTGLDDIVVGSLFAGRDAEQTENLVGFFVNTHVLRTRVSASGTFAELLAAVRETALEAVAHQRAPLDLIARELCVERSSARQPLFQVLFTQQPGATEAWNLEDSDTARIELDTGTAKFDLALLATDTPHGFRLRCEFSTAKYTEAQVLRMLGHYETLLSAALVDPDTRISALPLLTQIEREQVLCAWNNTEADWPMHNCIHHLFEEQARRTPSATAVVHQGAHLSYAELNDAAERLAGELRQRGVEPEVRVGICVRRSLRMLVGLLGILKAGGAYVAIDPAYPQPRQLFMLEDSRAELLLTERDLVVSLGQLTTRVLTFEELEADGTRRGSPPVAHEVAPGNLAYVIYTSGSTGTPKGVALEHRNAVALLSWAGGVYSAEDLAGVLAGTSICFDLSVFEIFVPLSYGGKVILAANATSLPCLPEANQVTLINTVPSAMRHLLDVRGVPQSVRVINLAGEPLDEVLVSRIHGETGVQRVFDLYGPSETATYSTGALRRAGAPPTIGRPLSNERVYVLSAELQPVPIGVKGELFIGGAGVARGYLDRPEITSARFLASPFVPGDRLYRTGDLARWREDGQLEFLGRADHQVKVRGYRIELGEIEAVLRGCKGVSDCTVVSHGDHLVAYVAALPLAYEETNVRRELSERLPEFMVPSVFRRLDRLPMTPNGKVDRAALPDPDLALQSVPATVVKPRTPTEEALAAIWQEVLGRNSFSVTDNFFHLGGHSLLAMQVVSRISSVLGRELPLRTIFEAPTIAELAAAITDAGAILSAPIRRQLRGAEARNLLRQLDKLSTAEVEELLRDWETTGHLS